MSSCESGCPLNKHSQEFRSSSKKSKNSHQWVMVTFVCCVFLCVAAVCAVIVYTHQKLKDLEEITARLKAEIRQLREEFESKMSSKEQDGDDYDYDDYKEDVSEKPIVDRIKRSINHHKRPHTPPYIHLIGRYGDLVTEKNITYFPWEFHPTLTGMHGINIIESDAKKEILKVRILKTGLYFAYSQIATHGRHNINHPHECSHETVLTRPNGGHVHSEVLMSSMVTQNQLGAPYERNIMNQTLRPLDTKLQVGVFFLNRNDELSVQVPQNCGSMLYSQTPKNAYFGVVEFSSKGRDPPPTPTKQPQKEKINKS